MPEEQGTVTKEQLLEQIGQAYNQGDFATMAKLSAQVAKIDKDEEKAAAAEADKALADLTKEVKAAIDKVVGKFKEAGRFDDERVQGVWYSDDFGTTETTCKLTKKAASRTGTGGGGGKKFDVKTSDLLEQFGSSVMNEETGQTFQEAWDESTEGNHRYKIRMKLIKLAGM